MRIGWIGGVERNEKQLEKLAEKAGHTLDFHSGHMQGRGSGDLRSIVDRSDFLVIVTGVNSHGAVLLAKKLAQKAGRGCLVVHHCGPSRFQSLLEAMQTRDERQLQASGWA